MVPLFKKCLNAFDFLIKLYNTLKKSQDLCIIIFVFFRLPAKISKQIERNDQKKDILARADESMEVFGNRAHGKDCFLKSTAMAKKMPPESQRSEKDAPGKRVIAGWNSAPKKSRPLLIQRTAL
ncbi:MAG: hypothetical protein AB7F32_09460 [Victivallaceae bacterium]